MAENSNEPQLEWIQLRKDMGTDHYGENVKDKMARKIKDNPWVPIGCLATAAALTCGLWNFRQGKNKQAQLMMRLRVAAQGFTITALIVGVLLSARKTISKQ